MCPLQRCPPDVWSLAAASSSGRSSGVCSGARHSHPSRLGSANISMCWAVVEPRESERRISWFATWRAGVHAESKPAMSTFKCCLVLGSTHHVHHSAARQTHAAAMQRLSDRWFQVRTLLDSLGHADAVVRLSTEPCCGRFCVQSATVSAATCSGVTSSTSSCPHRKGASSQRWGAAGDNDTHRGRSSPATKLRLPLRSCGPLRPTCWPSSEPNSWDHRMLSSPHASSVGPRDRHQASVRSRGSASASM